MRKLRIILQSNKLYLLLLLISLIFAFIKIKIIKYYSKLEVSNTFTGIVVDYQYTNSSYKITLKNKEKIICYYYSTDEIDLSLGDILNVEGEFYEPSNNTIPNTFNYKKYLNHHKIFYLMKVSNYKVIKKNTKIKYKLKNYIIKKIDNNYTDTNGYLKAFLLGDKSSLDEYSTFQENGVSHLFALSGMHVGVLSGIIYFILRKSKYQDIIVLIFLGIFLSITNFSASLLRSVIFFTLLLINKKFDLNIPAKNLLYLTIFILIITNPLIIFDYGFLYSVVVSYGLIISSKYYKKNYFYNLFITSFFAFLFSLPITACLNYEINLLTIINNMLIVPLISLIVYPLSLLTFLFSFLEPVLTFTTFSLEKINTILNMLKVSLVIPKVNILFYLIYYVLLILFIKSNNIKYLLCGLCLIFSFKIKPLLYNETSIYFLDVKQGDSSLIINKNKLILIDTGGVNNYNVSDNTIKFIKSLGYNHLDLLLITHGDSDHMKDGINVVNNIRVDKVIFNNGDYNELEEELINVLEDKKINYYQGLKEIDISNIKFNFLNTGSYDNENDNSNVIYFEIYKYKFLFMGDASVNRENDVLTNYNLSNIDFLKVGHHGSNTSSSKDFINSISPKYSVISVGKNNRYGHPKAEVLDNLANTKIYRTDEDGSVAIKINKNGYKILTYTP